MKRKKPALSKLSGIAEGLAAWLTFEAKCGRRLLFSEFYLKCALAQLLKFQFLGRVRHERKHPVLAKPGHNYRVDYVVLHSKGSKNHRWKIAIEVKWARGQSHLLHDLLKDTVRLSLLVPDHAEHAALILAGRRQDLDELFHHRLLQTGSGLDASISFLPLVLDQRRRLPLKSIARSQQHAYFKTLVDSFEGVNLPETSGLRFIGRQPLNPEQGSYGVCVWRISRRDVSARSFEVISRGIPEKSGTATIPDRPSQQTA